MILKYFVSMMKRSTTTIPRRYLPSSREKCVVESNFAVFRKHRVVCVQNFLYYKFIILTILLHYEFCSVLTHLTGFVHFVVEQVQVRQQLYRKSLYCTVIIHTRFVYNANTAEFHDFCV